MWSLRNGSAAVISATDAAVARSRAILPHGTAALGSACWWQSSAFSCADGGLFLRKYPQCRALHCSALLCGSRNLLRKLVFKHKKKFWYESPTLGSHLVCKPSNLGSALNLAPPKVNKEDSIRKRTLNSLFFKAVRDVLSTCEAGQEVYDLNVELSKASLTSDFSVCRIYWKSTVNKEQDYYIDSVLRKRAPRIRHILISSQVLKTIPIIVFVRDKEDAALREIEALFETLDFGPQNEENELVQNHFDEPGSTTDTTHLDTKDSSIYSNMFGIDHEALNKQIIEYKKMKKDKEIEGVGLSERQQEQLAEIRKHKKMRWQKTKKPSDDDITPQKYLMDKYSEDYWDNTAASSQENEVEFELQEMENELEVDDGTTKLKQTNKLK
ncbi:LOW QUALITY PROTEIN: putative ribosome-binding factor A, mitochondrial [Hemicordylus capensis]|uniref:LOW QUALITY PROTEIN: putative ribosome-binding factor A, mitochondrial n=1 Tax=Hemicordylus capensis TaxID=884348 RepID=UPI002302C5C8|nr:LOW QUALITY PROTEIN: putative ribosome-binding factor A, mitochondrial [Hemicordylus capensis]